jgi:flagellar protein FliJ
MLLRIRKRQEELRALVLASTRREVRGAEEQRESISQEQRRTMESARDAVRERFNASEVRQLYQYERHLARLGVESDARLQELQRQAEQQREELIEASQKKRIVERLKERHEEALFQEFRKQEQKLADEVAVNYTVLGQPRKDQP